LKISRKSSIYIFPGTTGSFWVHSPQAFFVLSYLGLTDFRTLIKIFYELGDHQEVLHMDIPWHNWIVLGSESPNIFCFVLFGIIRLQETFEKKNEGLKINRKSSIYYSLGQLARFEFIDSKHFSFCLIWD
jgi:hypothetical protein